MRLQSPLDDIFRGPSHIRVLRALHQLPVGLAASAREIARRAGVSHPTASKALASLAERGLVARTRTPRATAFGLRRGHTAVERISPLFVWEEQLRQELIALLRTEILRYASESVTAAYLFGSAADGEMTTTSDIDVAVLHAPGASAAVAAAMEEIGDRVQERFGAHLNFLLADSRPSSRLWRQILRGGIPILDPQAKPADG